MTKISLTDAHLQTIETALEIYTRLRLGQFDTAIEEAFPDAMLSWEERQNIHRFLRNIVMPEKPRLEYDGHGGYYDQYGNSYGEDREIGENLSFDRKNFLERASKNQLLGGYNSSYGICSDKIGDANIAYEIRQTIRQFLAVKRNGGWFPEFCNCNYDDPLKVSKEPLPKIENFSIDKYFPFIGKAVNAKLHKHYQNKEWNKLWEVANEYMKRKHPEIKRYGKAEIIKKSDSNNYSIKLEKPVKCEQP